MSDETITLLVFGGIVIGIVVYVIYLLKGIMDAVDSIDAVQHEMLAILRNTNDVSEPWRGAQPTGPTDVAHAPEGGD